MQFLKEVGSRLQKNHPLLTRMEYENFWKDQSKAPINWLGLLFTIVCLAAQFQLSRLDTHVNTPEIISIEKELHEMVQNFRAKTVACLILGDYAKGGPYVLETLLLYIAVELFVRKDAEIGIWMLLGKTVQLAMHMGYHRDPKHFKNLSAFTSEMRKRVWATISELDVGISTQMGLPRLIKPHQADTTEPSNLRDNDFDSETIDMPPTRPESELTPMLYRIVKSRLMATIGSIWDAAVDTRPCAYTEIMDMDSKLDIVYCSIPGCLQWHSLAHSILDSPQIIMQKMFLEIIFHRAKIVLHRRFLDSRTDQDTYSYSQRACLDSALKLLKYQQVLHDETQPWCRLYQERWRISSLVNHDFLLATSILCLYLKHVQNGTLASTDTLIHETIWTSLRTSHDIWLHSSISSKEARSVVNALGVILRNGEDPRVNSGTEATVPEDCLAFLNSTSGCNYQGR